MIQARIYRPALNAMQSGKAVIVRPWRLEILPQSRSYIDPLMGWTGMTDTTQELHLGFDTREEAIEYAQKNGISFTEHEPQKRVVKPKSYATNFAYNKVE